MVAQPQSAPKSNEKDQKSASHYRSDSKSQVPAHALEKYLSENTDGDINQKLSSIYNETNFSLNANESMREDLKSATRNYITNSKVPKYTKGFLKFIDVPETNEAVKLRLKIHSMPGYVPKLGDGAMGVISPKLMNQTTNFFSKKEAAQNNNIGQFIMDHDS